MFLKNENKKIKSQIFVEQLTYRVEEEKIKINKRRGKNL